MIGIIGRGLLLVLTGTATACAISVKDQDVFTYVPAPESWQAPDSDRPVIQDWLSSFSDEQLKSLVDEALSGNFDLQRTASRVQSFQAQRKASNAGRWPQLSTQFEAARSGQDVAGSTIKSNDFSLNLLLGWELDVWQRLTSKTRGAVLDVEAANADLEAARLSLSANIARAWYDAITTRRQVVFAETTQTSFANNLEVIETRYRHGIGDALDVTLARANLESARSQTEARRIQADNTVLQLETLLGRYPSNELAVADKIPDLSPVPGAGVPAQLVERRPDLRAAHLKMLAEGERLRAANRNYLPGVNLSASYGARNDDIGDLFDLDDLVWRIASQLTAPLFQAGRLEAERELAAATQAQSVLNYASLALNAFREVESALRTEKFLEAQQQALSQAADESVRAEALAQERYTAGLVDITTLLDAQRRAVDSRRGLIDLRNQRLQNRINLFVALGGNFKMAESSQEKKTNG